jgi:hypothetical protein
VSRFSVLMLPVLFFLSGSLGAEELSSSTAGQGALIQLSTMIADYLEKLEEKLVADRQRWTKSMDLVESGAKDLQDASTLDRQKILRAEGILRYRNAWNEKPFRRPILFRIAEVDLAIDNVSRAELQRLAAVNKERGATLESLIALVGQLKTGQRELTAYLKDSSLLKKVGEIDASGVAVAVAEARALRHSLSGAEDAEINVEAERERLEQTLRGFRDFLDYLDRATGQEEGGP